MIEKEKIVRILETFLVEGYRRERIIDEISIDDIADEVVKLFAIHVVMPRTFTKQSLKDAYIQGYRKRAIMSGLKYDHISELNAVTEFENWYVNLYGA